MNARTEQERLASLYALRDRVDREIRELSSRPNARKKRAVIVCGTESGYQKHRREGTERCDACKVAHSVHNRIQARERKNGANL